MRSILLENNFPPIHIIESKCELFQAYTGMQYFDVFTPKENEVFIDAGSYDGNTIIEFVNWAKGSYKKIIALEPLTEMCKGIEAMCKEKNIKNVQFENAAVWNKKEQLTFSENKAGSRIEEGGEIHIRGVALDSVVGQETVTFIKMDIEGSELKALEGAANIIKRDKPRLAISVYHKPEDIIELPSYILNLVPEYKFYIRHYRSNICETVLYGEV